MAKCPECGAEWSWEEGEEEFCMECGYEPTVEERMAMMTLEEGGADAGAGADKWTDQRVGGPAHGSHQGLRSARAAGQRRARPPWRAVRSHQLLFPAVAEPRERAHAECALCALAVRRPAGGQRADAAGVQGCRWHLSERLQ